MKATEVIQRIERPYAGKECIQVMMPYTDTLTILSENGMLYHHKPGSEVYVNKYLEDERRFQFPYSNIPTHYTRKGLFGKRSHTNQLLNYETPYLRIGDGLFFQSYAIKDNDSALLINKVINPQRYSEHMTYNEVVKLISKQNEYEEIYYVTIDGSLLHYQDSKLPIPSEETIFEHIKGIMRNRIRDLELARGDYDDTMGNYIRNNPWMLDSLKSKLYNNDFSGVDFNVHVGETMFVVRINKGTITVQGISIELIQYNDYKVDLYNIPINRYTLEQLKYVSKIRSTKEPKIPLRINPGVSRQDIIIAKQKVMELKK